MNEDLELIVRCSGQDINDEDFNKLKKVYSKLKFICDLLAAKGYKYEIRQDPRRQAGQSKFVFQDYQWAKVYPAEHYPAALNKFAYIVGFSDTVHFHLMGIKEFQEAPPSRKASKACWTEIDFETYNYDEIAEQFVLFDNRYRNLFIRTGAELGIAEFIKLQQQMNENKIVDLLRYKKQIILQGPPGTGKTRLAKRLASAITGLEAYSQKTDSITDSDIISSLEGAHKIPSAAGQVEYKLVQIDRANKTVTLKKSTETDATTTFEKIRQFYENGLWANSIGSNEDRRAAALAKFIFIQRQKSQALEASDQYKIIQFHPSYTYEDFVRGIVTTPNDEGDGILYEAENKILGEFASKAYRNLADSNAGLSQASEAVATDLFFNAFLDFVEHKLLETNHKIPLSPTLNITEIKKDAFRIASEGWKGDNLKFSQILKLYEYGITNRSELVNYPDIAKTVYHRTSYYLPVVGMFKEFIQNHPKTEASSTVQRKHYILIIDEINRANLSSVLGELIYALEYRGETVESMYTVDGSSAIILPDNLFIIGTMNTADRSVGHIDYAIRRRFAFVNVFPEDLSGELGAKFHKKLFQTVSALFSHDTYLSPEFEPTDVQLGHSYFIDKSDEGGSMDVRLEFEIKPILREYVKDAILIGADINDQIEQLTV